MYEYKIEIYKVKEAESKVNEMAKNGWRVVSVIQNVTDIHIPYRLVVTFEREIK